MERIIAGRFETKDAADAAAAKLAQFIDATAIGIFHNNPPGQHDAFPSGGDELVDAGSEGAGKSMATTALAAGLAAGAIGAVGGPGRRACRCRDWRLRGIAGRGALWVGE